MFFGQRPKIFATLSAQGGHGASAMQMPVGDLDSQINFSIRDTVCKAHLGPCNTVGTDRLVQLGNTILLCRICHGRQSLRHIHSRAVSSSCRHHSNGHDNDHHSMGRDHKGNNRRHTARRLRQASPKAPLRPPITTRASSSSPPGVNLNANILEDVPLRGTYAEKCDKLAPPHVAPY